jgi:autotransporter strand-loop-strand O-heptosyltransferase
MKIINVTPGLIPIPPNGWGAVEKIIWETHNALLKLGHNSTIEYLDDVKDCDVVHIHVANLANIAHERGIPYYFTMHDHHAYLYGKDSAVFKENMLAIKNAKKAFVPAKFLVGYFGNIPEYFSHGVNIDYFTPSGTSEPKLLCVANNGFIHDQAEDRKGFGYAIEAAKRLNLPITIAGPSNNKRYFEKYPSDYEKLTILYDLTEDQLKDLYKEHSCFLHLSTLEAGHPNLTLLEAMASGLPVVGTYEDGNSLDGMIVVGRDVDQTVKAIEEVFANPTRYLYYSNTARMQAKDLSWENRTKELLKHYTMSFKKQLIDSYNNTKIIGVKSKPLSPVFNMNFIDGAFFEILGGPDREYNVQFINKKTGQIVHKSNIKKDHWVKASISYFVDWSIFVDDGLSSYEFKPDYTGKRVYIALDSKALGDTLAWFPYVEEFRKKHNCKVVCSTFWNHFFKPEYPEIEFVKPGEVVNNIYAMYTLGWFYTPDGSFDFRKVPENFRDQSLQKTASDILGLEFKEVKPKIKLPKIGSKERKVTIAMHSTAQCKYWNNETGWQKLVDYLLENKYEVVMVSKEEDGYMGNKYPKGVTHLLDSSLESVISEVLTSEMFIGISSGLSWLAWALGTNTCLISGITKPESDFTPTVRISPKESVCRFCFNKEKLDPGDWNWCPKHKGTDRQFECTKTITAEDVISKISNLL